MPIINQEGETNETGETDIVDTLVDFANSLEKLAETEDPSVKILIPPSCLDIYLKNGSERDNVYNPHECFSITTGVLEKTNMLTYSNQSYRNCGESDIRKSYIGVRHFDGKSKTTSFKTDKEGEVTEISENPIIARFTTETKAASKALDGSNVFAELRTLTLVIITDEHMVYIQKTSGDKVSQIGITLLNRQKKDVESWIILEETLNSGTHSTGFHKSTVKNTHEEAWNMLKNVVKEYLDDDDYNTSQPKGDSDGPHSPGGRGKTQKTDRDPVPQRMDT